MTRYQKMARGQTMVLFALTLLLITLMVMMTLSFSTKAKEKMELQQVADQAAYSNSVVTARAFNAVAILNRVEIAHMVAIAGIQAALSYAALYRGFLQATMFGLEQRAAIWLNRGSPCGQTVILSACYPCCRAAAHLTSLAAKAGQEDSRVMQEWEALGLIGAYLGSFGFLDTRVALEAMAYQASAMAVYGFEMNAFVEMTGKLKDQSLTKEIVLHASGGRSEWVVPDAVGDINRREVGDITTGLGTVMGAAQEANPFLNRASVWAAMASRGNPWVTSRVGEMGLIEDRLNKVYNPGPTSGFPELPAWIPSVAAGLYTTLSGYYAKLFPSLPPTDPDLTFQIILPGTFLGRGNAYFGGFKHSALNPMTTNDLGVIADDHGIGVIRYWKSPTYVTQVAAQYPVISDWPILLDASSRAGAGLVPFVTNVHEWQGNFSPPWQDTIPKHMLLPTSGIGVWPLYIDYNFSKLLMPEDAYGQPKNFAVVQRDYRNRPYGADPWNLFFNFRLSGAGEKYGQSNTAGSSSIVLRDGTDISLQTALSTGITYYHRFDHWREPPNLFNPFWRAGLGRANIDPKPLDGVGRDWTEDVEQALNDSNVPWAADAVRKLDDVGFQGVQ